MQCIGLVVQPRAGLVSVSLLVQRAWRARLVA
jgi:hypothetical protein